MRQMHIKIINIKSKVRRTDYARNSEVDKTMIIWQDFDGDKFPLKREVLIRNEHEAVEQSGWCCVFLPTALAIGRVRPPVCFHFIF